MRNITFAAATTALALAALALTGCTSGDADTPDAGSPDAGPIKVVVFGGIGAEGVLASNSTTSVTSAKASVAAVNAAGGILGRNVEIEVIDDTGDPVVAVTKMRELLAGDQQPYVVMNSGPSTIADAMIPLLTQEKIISFNTGPTGTSSDPQVNPYNFDLGAPIGYYLDSFVAEIEERGHESVALLHGSTAYGELFGGMAAEKLGEAGYAVTGNEGYDSAALDMIPQLEKLRAGDPDVLILDAYGAPLGYVLQGMEKIDWDVPVIGNTSVAATGIISEEPPTGVLGTDQVKNLTMNVFASVAFDPDNTHVNDAVALMVESGEIKSSLNNALNIDAMLLYKAAAEKVGSFDAAAIAEALIDPEVQKNAGTVIIQQYKFSADLHAPRVEPSDFAFIRPGRLVNGQYQ